MGAVMRRQILRIFGGFLGLLSALAAVGLCWLWARSDRPDVLNYTSASQWNLIITSGHGTVDILVIPHWPGEPGHFIITGRPNNVWYATRYGPRYLGFGAGVKAGQYPGRFVNIPHWFLVSLFSVPPLWCAWRFWKRLREIPAGHCRNCGYDLRASPERCPECGTPVPQNPIGRLVGFLMLRFARPGEA